MHLEPWAMERGREGVSYSYWIFLMKILRSLRTKMGIDEQIRCLRARLRIRRLGNGLGQVSVLIVHGELPCANRCAPGCQTAYILQSVVNFIWFERSPCKNDSQMWGRSKLVNVGRQYVRGSP